MSAGKMYHWETVGWENVMESILVFKLGLKQTSKSRGIDFISDGRFTGTAVSPKNARLPENT